MAWLTRKNIGLNIRYISLDIKFHGTFPYFSFIFDAQEFCKVVQQVLRKEGRPSLFSDVSKLNLSPESWKAFRYNLMVRVEKSLTVILLFVSFHCSIVVFFILIDIATHATL